jgi:hypothetical protein
VRESIHAVESVVRVLELDGDFSKALARLEAKTNIHGARAFWPFMASLVINKAFVMRCWRRARRT